MAKYVMTNAAATINAVDLSAYVESVELTWQAEEVDHTTMNSTTTREKTTGLKDWSAKITFAQDHAAGAVDATLFALVGAAAFACTFKPVNAATSTSNPVFSGNAILGPYSPIAGQVGGKSMTSVTLIGSGALTRATS